MNEINQIIGEKVTSLSLLNWADEISEGHWIEKILFSFGGNKLLIEVDVNTDELSIKIGNELSLDIESPEHEILEILPDSNSELKSCLDKKLIWLWELKNNQGYDDAIQIEVSDHKENIIVQFIAEASQISIYTLKKIEQLATNKS
jgi:hypothetical protein